MENTWSGNGLVACSMVASRFAKWLQLNWRRSYRLPTAQPRSTDELMMQRLQHLALYLVQRVFRIT